MSIEVMIDDIPDTILNRGWTAMALFPRTHSKDSSRTSQTT